MTEFIQWFPATRRKNLISFSQYFFFFKLNSSFYALLIPFPYSVSSSSCNSSGSQSPFSELCQFCRMGGKEENQTFLSRLDFCDRKMKLTEEWKGGESRAAPCSSRESCSTGCVSWWDFSFRFYLCNLELRNETNVHGTLRPVWV